MPGKHAGDTNTDSDNALTIAYSSNSRPLGYPGANQAREESIYPEPEPIRREKRAYTRSLSQSDEKREHISDAVHSFSRCYRSPPN
eukprot:8607588-Pyramimonas_sp.AAC.1